MIERALAALADMTQTAGGDFLARRTVKEAWPLMRRHLHYPEPALMRCNSHFQDLGAQDMSVSLEAITCSKAYRG